MLTRKCGIFQFGESRFKVSRGKTGCQLTHSDCGRLVPLSVHLQALPPGAFSDEGCWESALWSLGTLDKAWPC